MLDELADLVRCRCLERARKRVGAISRCRATSREPDISGRADLPTRGIREVLSRTTRGVAALCRGESSREHGVVLAPEPRYTPKFTSDVGKCCHWNCSHYSIYRWLVMAFHCRPTLYRSYCNGAFRHHLLRTDRPSSPLSNINTSF